MKRVAILQSNYIPWRGYFDLLAAVDEFVLYDDVQYTRNDWRNRNIIKTPHGPQWLTVPVGESTHRAIKDVSIADPECGHAHWKRLGRNYARARHFPQVAEWLRPLYCDSPWRSLSDVNQRLIRSICDTLGITTHISRSSDYRLDGDRNERLIGLCRQAGASTYVSGPSAAAYLDVDAFRDAGMDVCWYDYAGYPDYPQLWGSFVDNASILDLLFNCGAEAPRYMKLGAR